MSTCFKYVDHELVTKLAKALKIPGGVKSITIDAQRNLITKVSTEFELPYENQEALAEVISEHCSDDSQREGDKDKRYEILVGDAVTLQDRVNAALLDGWSLHGSTGFNSSKNQFFQAVVRS
jgi:hypothetical protein